MRISPVMPLAMLCLSSAFGASAAEPLHGSQGWKESRRGWLHAERLDSADIATLSEVSDEELAALNRLIPEANRPVGAALYVDDYFKGFPATFVSDLVMVLDYPGGARLGCVDWDPAGDFPSEIAVVGKDCQIPDRRVRERMIGFEPGERIDLAFGTTRADEVEPFDVWTLSIGRGELVMRGDGSIAVGSWSARHVSAAAASARAITGARQRVVGRYYLDGHTISIVGVDGKLRHGFIGCSVDGAGEIDAIYLNGERYSDES